MCGHHQPAKRSSKQLGTAEGTSITSGLDGLSRIWVAKLTLCLKDHKGSSNVRLENSRKKTCLKIVIMANLLTMFFVMEMIVVSGFSFGASGLSMNYYFLSCPIAKPVVKNTTNRAR
ncbi:hypothetical protein JHK86_001047 [Glycine max]|nr:hypothetical protein JHK86_001047 [Glycine max]